MKKALFFAFNLFISIAAYAQEQITSFEGGAMKSPQKMLFVDTLKTKTVFFATQPDILNPTSLWVSDGTPAGTHIIKDAFGESPTYNNVNIREYGYRYLLGEHIWRTDGSKLERVLTRSDSLNNFHSFDNKLLLIFRKYENIGTQGFSFSTFTWLDTLNKISIWEKDVISYKIIDSTLHYIKFNKQTKYFELHKISNGSHKKNVIAISQTSFNINSFETFTEYDFDYYFLNTNQGKKLFSIQKKDSTNIDFWLLKDWGNDSSFPTIIKDTLNKSYFLQKTGYTLKVFAVLDSNVLAEKWSASLQNVYVGYNNFDYLLIRNISIIGSKLVFNTVTGSEGISGFYFNVLDMTSSKNRRSRNLGFQFGYKFYTTDISKIDSNTYTIDNKIGSIATYSFLADSIIQVTTYPYKSSSSPDSIFTINNKKILFTDNIYNISSANKTELIPSRQIFNVDAPNYFYSKIVGDKLLMWKYNPKIDKTQLWANDGKKKDSELLITLEGYFEGFHEFYKYQIVEMNAKVYFFSRNSTTNQTFIYETDGTKVGSHKIFETVYLEFLKANTRQIIFRTNEKRIFVFENGKGYLMDFFLSNNPMQVYQTPTQTYIISDYGEFFNIVDGRSVWIASRVSSWLSIYKNQVFFSKFDEIQNVNVLNSMNELGKMVEIAKNTFAFGIYGKKLIYKQQVVNDKPPKITIFDIPTNKIDLTIDNYYGTGFIPIQDAILIPSESKTVIIKDGQRKDYSNLIIQQEIMPFSKGFITKTITNASANTLSAFNYTYFDLETNQLYPITKANRISYESGKNIEYVLFYDVQNDSTNNVSYWTSKNKQIIALSNNEYLEGIDTKQAILINLRNRKYSYWYFDGNTLTKRYEFKLNNYSNLIKSDSIFYGVKNSGGTGNELMQFGEENIITFPEIVKGSEGIRLESVIHFNKQRYIYAFTYTYGWQVWKMGDGDKVTPLANEEMNDVLPNVFPNPVQDFLSIDSQQKYRYRVINSTGQEMMQGNIEPQQAISFKNLSQGLYIIQFFDGKKTFSKKVIKY